MLDGRQLFPCPSREADGTSLLGARFSRTKRNVVHRDIKPAKSDADADDTVKITDFGTAKILQFGTAQTSHVMGSHRTCRPSR